MQVVERQTAAAGQQWAVAVDDWGEDDQDLGAMERDLESNGREMLRAGLQLKAQRKADATPPNCPVCGTPLQGVVWREVEILTGFGPIKINRSYGRCPKCAKRFAPADHVLGLTREGKNSPAMAEKLRLLGTIAPPGQAEAISKTLMGTRVDDGRIARELEQAGREAIEERDRQDQRALDPEGRWQVTEEIAEPLPAAFTMIIMADGFMTRERDDWGRSEAIRAAGGEPERWHETKAGTIFLLDDRVCCGGKKKRSVILQRSFLATRRDAFDFGQMLYAQAVRQGLLRAKQVYFVADGGVWLWNIQKQRFADSVGTLDFYHASQHLYAVARARHGDGEQAKRWVQPLIHQLRHDGEAGVLSTLRDLADVVEAIEPERRDVDDKTILREWEYFNSHREHLAYDSRAKRGLPIGSGCIESTCKQYQLRVKRCGQFWSTKNLEGLLCLYGRYLQACWN